MIGTIALGAIASLLTGDLLWGGFSLIVVVVTLLPVLATADRTAIVPWSLLFVAAIVIVARTAEFYPEATGYIAIATLALIVVVELDIFTSNELSRRFAIVFGVLTTMAIEALWIIAQYFSDRWLGTTFLTTQTELQQDITTVTVVGFTVGGLFYWYFTQSESVRPIDRESNQTETR